jgi:hypothetical protein
MTQYLQQLKDDQWVLKKILENRRSDMANLDTPIEEEMMGPSLQNVYEAYISSLGDTLTLLGLYIDFFEADKKLSG